ncbi:unnamed protein product [Rotaria sp. Silwood2]|nr:unnamed protein product [Rotaria sp. Silwood2]CAF3870930.1 unnamed protein product [Rotaria sp. Silwood2]CAF3925590.1 unnamed protein product [Rotaria sp. Silwood2]
MATPTMNSSAPNLATLLLIKRKLAEKNAEKIVETQVLPTLSTTIGAHSNEKLSYRQNILGINSTATPTNVKESPKVSRQNKQLEVELLDKKMEEINRKQEVKTNEALHTWKGFDSLNYGFVSESETRKSTPISSISTKQRTPTPSSKIQASPVKTPEKIIIETRKQEPLVSEQSIETYPSVTPKQSTPQRIDSPAQNQPSSKLSLNEEEPQKESIDKQ